MNETVASLDAPARRRPTATGSTPHEQMGSGTPARAAVKAGLKPLPSTNVD